MIFSQKVEFANTLYSKYPLKNAGGDEQLTLRSFSSSRGRDYTRIILAPPQSSNAQWKYYNYDSMSLCLYPSFADLQYSEPFTIVMYPLISPDGPMWSSGISLDSYNSFAKDEGSSWIYRNSNVKWLKPGGDYSSDQSKDQTTVSYRTIYQKVEYSYNDLGGYQWGLLKFDDESINIGLIRYYSPNTNTIFYPRYTYYIDDYSWTASSNSVSTVEDYIVSIPKINLEYQQNQIERFYLRLTPQVYSRDWTTSYWSASSIEYCLTSSMVATYCLYDVTNIEKFKVFDHNAIYTRLSCDGQKNYFDIDMQQLPRNRFYQLQLKIDNKIYNIKDKFRVV